MQGVGATNRPNNQSRILVNIQKACASRFMTSGTACKVSIDSVSSLLLLYHNNRLKSGVVGDEITARNLSKEVPLEHFKTICWYP